MLWTEEIENRKTFSAHAIQLYQGKTDDLNLETLTSNEFINFCQEHRILSRMEKKLLPYFKPEKSKEYFLEKIKLSRLQALKQISAINIIAKLFNANGLTWLSFKGYLLCHVLFEDAIDPQKKILELSSLRVLEAIHPHLSNYYTSASAF